MIASCSELVRKTSRNNIVTCADILGIMTQGVALTVELKIALR